MSTTAPTTTENTPRKTTTTPAEAAPRRPFRWSMIALWLAVMAILALLAWGLINTTATRPEVG